MKLLTVVIPPEKLPSVIETLEVAGFKPMMVASAQTAVPSRQGLTYRGVVYADPSVVRVELLLEASETDRAASLICNAMDVRGGMVDEIRMWVIDALRPLRSVERPPVNGLLPQMIQVK